MATPASRFIGRADDRDLLTKLLADAPVVTVTGPGGIGKTRLAREATAQHPDRVVWCELSDLRAECSAQTIAGHLGYASVDAAAAALAEPPSLLVLDNCEHVLCAATDFVDQLGGSVAVLATSREPLTVDGEQVLVLEPLADAAATELFLDRATSAGARWDRSDETLDAIARLCRNLDNLPLAIELAAARARVLSPAEMLTHMDERLDLLRRPTRTGTSRHESVRYAFDISAALLDEEERDVFARLSVFAGPFDVDLAHAVAGPTSSDRVHTIDVLARLVDRSLVVAEPDGSRTRYRLLELLREYATELLPAEETDAAQDRFVGAMTAFADRMIAEGTREWSGDVIGRITAQLPNLASAIEWTVDRDSDPARAFRMILPLFAVIHQSRAPEALFLGGQVLLRWPEERAPFRAEALGVLAVAAVLTRDIERASTFAAASLDDSDGTGIARVLAHRALGFSARATHDEDTTREHFAIARAEALALGAAPFARELAGLEASALDALGRGDDAIAILDSTIDDATSANDFLNEAWIRLLRATTMIRRGDFTAAREDLDASHAAIAKLSVPWYEGATLRTEAILVAHECGWDASLPHWREAIERGTARGAAGEVALTLRAAAAVAMHTGHGDVAQDLLDATPPVDEMTVLPDIFDAFLTVAAPRRSAAITPPDLRTARERARALLRESPAAESEPAPAPPSTSTSRLQRDGDVWTVEYAGRSASVRDMKGMYDVATLLVAPGREIHCLELIGGTAVEGDVGATLDARARREYQERIVELQRDVEEAREHNDTVRAERAEAELDTFVAQLADAFGLGGRDRVKGSAAERARTAVANRVRAAIKRVTEVHPELGAHLANAVRTGTWCSYRPEREVDWKVSR